jgi:hypothetical protein
LSSNKQCYLCGVRSADTKDHLFPSGLFNKPLPSNLLTLPACSQCNNALSSDEEQFRVFVASGRAFETKAGCRIWTERIRPDLKGGRPRLKPLIKSQTKAARVLSESGTPLGYTWILEVAREIVNRVLRKIAKGLYFLDTGNVLPDDVQILMDYAADQPQRFISPPLDEAIKGAKRVDLGDGVVTYWRNTMKNDPTASITWLKFYEDKLFMICTFRNDTL